MQTLNLNEKLNQSKEKSCRCKLKFEILMKPFSSSMNRSQILKLLQSQNKSMTRRNNSWLTDWHERTNIWTILSIKCNLKSIAWSPFQNNWNESLKNQISCTKICLWVSKATWRTLRCWMMKLRDKRSYFPRNKKSIKSRCKI